MDKENKERLELADRTLKRIRNNTGINGIKLNWGGPREGAGRPKGTGKPIVDPDKLRTLITVRLPHYMIDRLSSSTEPNGRIVERALNLLWIKEG